MPWLAVVLLLAFLVLVFPLRSVRRARLHGTAGRADWRTPRPRSWKLADALFLGGYATLVSGTVLEATGVLNPAAQIQSVQAIVGVAMLAGAAMLAEWAQRTMGAAWRPDIPPVVDAQLVTTGPFRLVRNPNYVAMLSAGIGATMLAPNSVVLVGWVVLLTSLMLTARAEEPLLASRYGDAYRKYARQVGRFVPGIGLLE